MFSVTAPATPTSEGSFSYVLLSSSEHERFSNDVLRSLSAPVGAQVTFRYEVGIVENSILTEEPISEGDRGLVCHANMPDDGRGTLVPVRFVSIGEVLRPGSTVILELTMKGFAKYNGESFDKVAHNNEEWKEKYPYKESGEVVGNFVFGIEYEDLVSETKSIEGWESIAKDLNENGSVSQDYYFLITGRFEDKPENIEKVLEWKEDMRIDKNYEVPVYIFSPKSSRDNLPGDPLHIASSIGIESRNPIDLATNVPYDLKKWSIRVPSQNLLGTGYEWTGQREGWIQIGPKAPEGSKNDSFKWQIDLDLTYGRSFRGFAIAASLLAVLYAITFFSAVANLNELPTGAVGAIAFIFGIAVALITLGLQNVSR